MIMEETIHEECRGCMMIQQDTVCLTLSQFKTSNHTYNCPCQTCLIKVMCERTCDIYREYTNIISMSEIS